MGSGEWKKGKGKRDITSLLATSAEQRLGAGNLDPTSRPNFVLTGIGRVVPTDLNVSHGAPDNTGLLRGRASFGIDAREVIGKRRIRLGGRAPGGKRFTERCGGSRGPGFHDPDFTGSTIFRQGGRTWGSLHRVVPV